MNIIIENVMQKDYEKIKEVEKRAFSNVEHSGGDEHNLVERLRKEMQYHPEFEIVAKTLDGEIIGHAMLSEIKIIQDDGEVTIALALAPIAVLPEYQSNGIGSRMIDYLQEEAKAANYVAISIAGDPNYYCRFGYVPASEFGIRAGFDIPDKYYMIKPLFENSLEQISGVIEYQKAFRLS